MSRWHPDDHAADEEPSKHAPRAEPMATSLRQLKQLTREAELARQLKEEQGSPGRRTGKK